ncbi:hypothetical protein [Streptomyces flavofungini]|uniref:hypothetical protein n=1 Tax=Streptomyces flavofungini TaxID=68200 RepID=UPI0025B0EC23|nr:hypothetical protein [Streptomyces flavofungini]WJV51645.1 hypothetical protein QUY26_39095 [Streptomyces flavofungini]
MPFRTLTWSTRYATKGHEDGHGGRVGRQPQRRGEGQAVGDGGVAVDSPRVGQGGGAAVGGGREGRFRPGGSA